MKYPKAIVRAGTVVVLESQDGRLHAVIRIQGLTVFSDHVKSDRQALAVAGFLTRRWRGRSGAYSVSQARWPRGMRTSIARNRWQTIKDWGAASLWPLVSGPGDTI